MKTVTATTQEPSLGRGAAWILSGMKARGAAGSAFIQPLALEGVASRLVSG